MRSTATADVHTPVLGKPRVLLRGTTKVEFIHKYVELRCLEAHLHPVP